MRERGRRAAVILGAVVLACGALALAGLMLSAGRDAHPEAWSGRVFGFVTAAVAAGIGGLILALGRSRDTHYWGTVGALALAALLLGAYSYRPNEPQMGDRAETVPLEIGSWHGTSHQVDDQTKKILRTEDIVMRTYRSGADSVGLAVIFAMGSRKVVHPPEQCYSADGFEIEALVADSFTTPDGQTIKGQRLVITKGGVTQVVFYTYKVEDRYTGKFALQQFYVIWLNLLARSGTRVALIRFSTEIAGESERDTGTARLKAFARESFPEIQRALK